MRQRAIGWPTVPLVLQARGRCSWRLRGLLLLALTAPLAAPVAGQPTSDPLYLPEAGQQEWDRRLEDVVSRLRTARSTLERVEAEVTEARREEYPRGEPLERLRARLSAARDRWQRLRERAPALLEEARRAGVLPEVLRRHRSEIRTLSQSRSAEDQTKPLDAVDRDP